MNDLRPTIVPKSDQLNADDLIGRTLTVKIAAVRLTVEADQPVALNYEGDDGKPYKPCKSMRRVLVTVWGPDGNAYVGRSMTLYRDEKVQFGGMAVGGIRISHMSNLDQPMTMALTASRASKRPFTVQPLIRAANTQMAATRNPEPAAPHSNGDDRPDMDGAVADFADLLEFEIDGATHYPTLAKHINETTKTKDWAALKAADPERARLLKDKATARVAELREASERTVAA